MIINNFKTNRYLNNFQEHLFGILRLRKYQTSLQNFFPRENEAIKHDLVEFKVQCLKVFVAMATNIPSCFSIQFLEQLLKFLVNFTLLKYAKSQRSYGFLITKELIFGFQILDVFPLFSLLKSTFFPVVKMKQGLAFSIRYFVIQPHIFMLVKRLVQLQFC